MWSLTVCYMLSWVLFRFLFVFLAQERELKWNVSFVAFGGLSIFSLRINVAKLSSTEKMLVLFYGLCHWAFVYNVVF